MFFYCISPVAMFLAHGELAHQWARTLATTTGMSMERCEATRECEYLLAARKLRSREVTRGLIQYVTRLIVRAFTV